MIRFSASVLATSAIVIVVSACSNPVPPPARVILESDFGPGDNPPTGCSISDTSWVDIGGFGNPPTIPVRTVDNGTNDDGAGNVDVTCSVTGNDTAGYEVAASATLEAGTTGGTISITGHFTTSGTQSPVNVVFQRADYGTFTETDCTADYNYQENPNMGIAAGRVWAELNCPTLIRPDENLTCSGTAQFRFENCDQ